MGWRHERVAPGTLPGYDSYDPETYVDYKSTDDIDTPYGINTLPDAMPIPGDPAEPMDLTRARLEDAVRRADEDDGDNVENVLANTNASSDWIAARRVVDNIGMILVDAHEKRGNVTIRNRSAGAVYLSHEMTNVSDAPNTVQMAAGATLVIRTERRIYAIADLVGSVVDVMSEIG